MTIAYLGLGANLGDRAANLAEVLRRIASPRIRVLRASSLWETAPQGKLDQPWFLNQVIEVETDLSAPELLEHVRSIEAAMGRVRIPGERNHPRVIDIDILLFGEERWSTPELEIPHPRLAERRFVLEPLTELVPRFSEMLPRVADQQVRRL